MGFADASKLPPDAEQDAPKGKMYHIACMTWFTASGSLRPISFKFEDENKEIQSVGDIFIQYSEDRNYSGLPSKEFGCRAVIGGLNQEFRLIYYLDACKWVMMIY